MAQISATSTWPGLTKPGYGAGEPGMYYPTGQQTYFRTISSDELQGAVAARWAAQLGYKSAYLIYSANTFGEGIAGVFELTANDEGIQLAGKNTFNPDIELTPTDGLKQEDVNLLQSIANQVANALRNARSFTEAQQRADRKAMISSISQKIQSTTTVESAIQVAVREMGRAFGTQASVRLNSGNNHTSSTAEKVGHDLIKGDLS